MITFIFSCSPCKQRTWTCRRCIISGFQD